MQEVRGIANMKANTALSFEGVYTPKYCTGSNTTHLQNTTTSVHTTKQFKHSHKETKHLLYTEKQTQTHNISHCSVCKCKITGGQE